MHVTDDPDRRGRRSASTSCYEAQTYASFQTPGQHSTPRVRRRHGRRPEAVAQIRGRHARRRSSTALQDVPGRWPAIDVQPARGRPPARSRLAEPRAVRRPRCSRRCGPADRTAPNGPAAQSPGHGLLSAATVLRNSRRARAAPEVGRWLGTAISTVPPVRRCRDRRRPGRRRARRRASAAGRSQGRAERARARARGARAAIVATTGSRGVRDALAVLHEVWTRHIVETEAPGAFLDELVEPRRRASSKPASTAARASTAEILLRSCSRREDRLARRPRRRLYEPGPNELRVESHEPARRARPPSPARRRPRLRGLRRRHRRRFLTHAASESRIDADVALVSSS